MREFIKDAVKACTKCEVTAKRITRSLLLDYDYEIKNPTSEFSMVEKDFANPKGRLEHAFTFKHLKQVDEKKVKRMEDYINLIALKSYKEKYETEDYDEEIETLTKSIEADPVEEIDSLITIEAVAQGVWSS